jgi:hypothetical protein
VFVAAQEGHVGVIRELAEHGADLNTSNNNGATPVYVAAQNGHVGVIRELAEHGADLKTPRSDGSTPVFVAAQEGHVVVIRALAKHGVDIDSLYNLVNSPLRTAIVRDHREASTFLVNIGADVKQCLQYSDPRFDHIREMLTQFGVIVGLQNKNINNNDGDNAKCALFSLTKLMCCFFLNEISGNDDDNADDVHRLLETNIAISVRHAVSSAGIEHMQAAGYVLKRRLVRVAWKVYQSTLLLDGDRLTAQAKARRYVELVCFLFDLSMLRDVVALRMTCKSNNERRRFPVYYVAYSELEANIVEEWLGYGSCRFVSTAVIHTVIAIHSHALEE